ncbi:hypothetical protein F5X99DRAFT_19582 [Biscogniauxia marginata]|nr:hypothetical protein F5X99DRAFT_19582 [Biscogniauxia marginata]
MMEFRTGPKHNSFFFQFFLSGTKKTSFYGHGYSPPLEISLPTLQELLVVFFFICHFFFSLLFSFVDLQLLFSSSLIFSYIPRCGASTFTTTFSPLPPSPPLFVEKKFVCVLLVGGIRYVMTRIGVMLGWVGIRWDRF